MKTLDELIAMFESVDVMLAEQGIDPTVIVVNKKTEEYDVDICRGTKWGNRNRISNEHDRDTVIKMHWNDVVGDPDLLSQIIELKGKRMGCVCKPKDCHGDNYALLANTNLRVLLEDGE